jgi:signal transduction histidine kinase
VATVSSQPARLTVAPVEKTTGGAWERSPSGLQKSLSGSLGDHPNDLPCVLFEAKPSLEIVSASPNMADLLGVNSASVIHQPSFLQHCVAAEDRYIFQENIAELENSGSVSFVHRFVQASGLPVWVSHSLRKIERNGESIIRGCLVPISGASRLRALEQEVVSRFIHKLGNHFQLLNLVLNSLKKTSRQPRETEILEQTIENAIDLTRTFSEYCQSPNCTPIVDFAEIVNAAVTTRNQSFLEKQVVFRRIIDEASLKEVIVEGDAYLLELALGHVLENALEATAAGRTVVLHAMAEIAAHDRAVVRLRVVDSGAGIEIEKMDRINLPFYTTKMNHNGLGLSMAVRFVEVHGGLLTVKSGEGQGTEVTITLPAVTSEQVSESLRL